MKQNNLEKNLQEETNDRKIDLYVDLPCLMKEDFNKALEAYKKDELNETGIKIQSFAPPLGSRHLNFKNTIPGIKEIKEEERFPDILVDFAVGNFTSNEVRDRFIKKEAFTRTVKEYNAPFIDSKLLKDENGAFNVLGLFSLAMIVNLKKLSDLPRPKSFKDLLDPKYKGRICILNLHNDLNLLLLHYIYSLYGEKGLHAFKENVSRSLNTTNSSRKVDSSKIYSIFFVPMNFAIRAVIPGLVEIVWPEEGNVCQPIVMIVKKELKEENKKIVDFLLSEKIADVFSKNGFVTTFEGHENKIPKNAKFSWPGFDYFLSEDFTAKNDYVLKEFAEFDRNKKA